MGLLYEAVTASSGFRSEVELSVMGELLGDGKAAWPSQQFRRVRSESPRNRTGPFLPSSAMLMEMVSL